MSCKDITQFIFVCRTLKSPLKQQKETIDRLVVRSSKMRVPSDFQKFMNNNNNKGRLSEIIEETLLSQVLTWEYFRKRKHLETTFKKLW